MAALLLVAAATLSLAAPLRLKELGAYDVDTGTSVIVVITTVLMPACHQVLAITCVWPT